MDFRYHFVKSRPLSDKKLDVWNVAPDGNEIHSCQLHFSNGNLFEQLKFYILHIDFIGLIHILS